MITNLLIILGLIALLMIIRVLWVRLRRVPNTTRGMKAFARDLASGKSPADYFSHRDAMEKRAPYMSDEEIAKGVEILLGDNEQAQWLWKWMFDKIGPRSEPVLLRALNDPRCDSSHTSTEWNKSTAFERITEILARMGNGAVVEWLLPWAKSEDERKSQLAALRIAQSGQDVAIVPTVEALSSGIEHRVEYALIGVENAAAGHVASSYKAAVSEQLARLLTDCAKERTDYLSGAPGAFAALNPEVARRVLLSEQVLRPDSPILYHVLKAINENRWTTTTEMAMSCLQESRKHTNYPWMYVHAESIVALALAAPEAARHEITASMESEESCVVEGVARALRILYDLPSPYELWPKSMKHENLPSPVRGVVDVAEYRYEVENGGHAQYFFNSSGDRWKSAHAALLDMGAPHAAGILADAVRVAGHDLSSADREKRIKAYAKSGEDLDESLNSLDSRFNKDEDRLNVIIALYMQRHRSVVLELAAKARAEAAREP